MDLSFQTLIILVLGCSLAAFVDAAVGGGGIISLPVYLISGFNPYMALGTNKLTSSAGTIAASINFLRYGKISLKLLMFYIPCTFIGSMLGAKTVLLVHQDFLRPVITALTIIIAVFTLFSRKMGTENHFDITKVHPVKYASGFLFAFILGFYDGFFGPGTGSFLILCFIFIFKMDFVMASANAKILNLTSNISALIFFAIEGKINYTYGLIVMFFVVPAAILGSRLTVKKGVKFIKPLFVTMSILLSLKLIFDMIK